MVESTVRSQYDRLAPIYDQRWRGYVSRTLTFLCRWMTLASDETVLDVACGTGELARLILDISPHQAITGIDLSEKMLQQARRKCPTAEFKAASVTALPFGKATFDRVVSANAFHYFEPVDRAITEMSRVLKPSGQLVILDWCRDDWLCQLCDWSLKLIDPAHRQCYTQAEFHALLQHQGLAITAHRRVRFGWWGLMIVTCTTPG
ncbi:MAG: methyltransferase domain-containing protein [Cyanobacteria bacterium J06648_16]